MSEIKGICPIIATPFYDNGEVDYESLDKLVKHLIKGGCHAVTLFGIAGEYYKLSDDERKKMVEVTVKAAKEVGGKTIVSVTDHATELAVKTAKFFEESGADCLMLLPPFFLKPGASYLYEHMKAIANAVKIPIIGMGGIATAEDALEFILAGASAVAVGTANFTNPYTTIEVVKGIEDYMRRHKVTNLTDLIGIVK